MAPDAWDDDWVVKADSNTATAATVKPEPTQSKKASKQERRAKQAEFNRQLWQEAEDPHDNYFLKTRDVVPLKSEFKPTMQVLSRKPKPAGVTGGDTSLGVGQLGLEDDEDSDDESKKVTLTAQERQEKAAREREEKQKKYEELRSKIFGSDENSNPGSSSPVKKGRDSRNQSRSKTINASRPSSSASNKNRQLYDPNDTGKPGVSSMLKRETKDGPDEIQPIRAPKNPDNSGRGGFGFAPRGGRVS